MASINKYEHDQLMALIKEKVAMDKINIELRNDILEILSVFHKYQENISVLRHLIDEYAVIRRRIRFELKKQSRKKQDKKAG